MPAAAARHRRSPVLLRAQDDAERARLRARTCSPARRSRASDGDRARWSRPLARRPARPDGRSELSPPRAWTSSSTARRRCRSSSRWTRVLELNVPARRGLLRGAARRPGSTRTSSTSPRPTPPGSAPAWCSSAPPASRPGEPDLDLEAELAAAPRLARRPRGRVAPARCTSSASCATPGARSAPPAAPAVGARAEAAAPRMGLRDELCRARPRALARARLDRRLRALEGDRRAHAAWPQDAARADDRAPGDHRVRAAHAVPRLDRGAEGGRSDPARLRRRAWSPAASRPTARCGSTSCPVDLVANACIAAAAHPPSDGVRTSTSPAARATR